jgi:hypothetical protein
VFVVNYGVPHIVLPSSTAAQQRSCDAKNFAEKDNGSALLFDEDDNNDLTNTCSLA